MSYIDLNFDFSQFDRDNSARHHAAGYAKVANALAAVIPGDPGGKLGAADAALRLAQAAFAAHLYEAALAHARSAYELVAEAARLSGVPVQVLEPSTWTVLGPVKPGNGPGKGPVAASRQARDLDERANVKRMYSP
jgi:hypothetical protein